MIAETTRSCNLPRQDTRGCLLRNEQVFFSCASRGRVACLDYDMLHTPEKLARAVMHVQISVRANETIKFPGQEQ